MGLRRIVIIIGISLLLALGGCGAGRDDDTGAHESTAPAAVNFLMFPNPQPSLGVSTYDVLISNGNGFAVNYSLTVTQTSGVSQTSTGSVPASPGTATHSFEQTQPGGVTISLNSSGAALTLTLRNGGTTSVVPAATGVNPVSSVNPSITLPESQIDSVAYATAYYAAIDPGNERETLAEFKTENGFGTDCAPDGTTEFEVRFRDVLDLGYGRHMCARGSTTAVGNVAVWVENFQVTAVPGIKYGPLNLEAVVNDDRRWHVGTNAIEYAPANPLAAVSATNPRIVKFYTFNPDGTRRLLVDLDGRGAKAMPVPCISCHGGHALPLTASGLFPAIRTSPRGETLARMQPLNVDTLDFSPYFPYRRSDQEATLKNINRLVLCTFPLVGAAGTGGEDNCRTPAVNNEWGGTAASMVKHWYGGTGNNGLPNATQSDTFIPTEWEDGQTDTSVVPNVAIPTGATNLYQTAVVSNCRVCHLLRGNQNEHDINFASYGKFADPAVAHTTSPPLFGRANSYNVSIKHHVFDKGNMPLALLKWEQFWESTAPATLASWITGAMSGGSVLQPTRPVAKPGSNRTIVTNVPVRLSGAESTNATSYIWEVIGANASDTTLTNRTSVRPTFMAIQDGVYTVRLTVSNGSATSEPATQTIGAVGQLQDGASIVAINDPADIRFSHIKTILQDNTTYRCTDCHTTPTGNPSGPPVYYSPYDRVGDGNPASAANDHQFYLDVRARINFTDVESSRLLFRPSGHHHPGDLIANFDTSVTPGNAGRGAYDIFLNWILNGAPE